MTRMLVENAFETAELADLGKGTYMRIHLTNGITITGQPCALPYEDAADRDIWEIHSLGGAEVTTVINVAHIAAIEIVVKS